MPEIGSIKLKNRLIAAPMAGISDMAFRCLMRNFGVGLTYTEMISSDGLFHGNKKTMQFSFVPNESPIAVQIFGNNPHKMAVAAKYYEQKNATIIDINYGCPVKKIIKQGSGSALQRNTHLAKEVMKAVRESISIPMTIKLRLGWSRKEENYLELASYAESIGINAIALHPRYAVQQFRGTADWQKYIALKKICTIPIIASGDVTSSCQIESLITDYTVDFVMLGRVLMGSPFIIRDYLALTSPTLTSTIIKHFNYLLKENSEINAAKKFRKFISKYIKGQPNATILRHIGNQIKSLADVEKLCEQIL